MKLGLMLYTPEKAMKIGRGFTWIGRFLEKIFFSTKYGLAKAGIGIPAEKYLAASFFSALAYGSVFFFIFYFILFFRDGAISSGNSVLAGLIGIVFALVFFFIHLIYPEILAKRYASGIEQGLIFALKSMLVQVNSGIPLFDAMVNVSRSNYGNVSAEFGKVVKGISSGESEALALEKLALNTRSEHLKKTAWQLLTSIRSGASVQGALATVVESLSGQQVRAIRDFAAELNLWILLYLLLAAAIPTLGITFMVVLSAMSGASIGPEHIIMTIAGAAAMQFVLIGFVRTRVPKVYA